MNAIAYLALVWGMHSSEVYRRYPTASQIAPHAVAIERYVAGRHAVVACQFSPEDTLTVIQISFADEASYVDLELFKEYQIQAPYDARQTFAEIAQVLMGSYGFPINAGEGVQEFQTSDTDILLTTSIHTGTQLTYQWLDYHPANQIGDPTASTEAK